MSHESSFAIPKCHDKSLCTRPYGEVEVLTYIRTLLTLGLISLLFVNPYPWMGVRGFGDYRTALGNPWSTA